MRIASFFTAGGGMPLGFTEAGYTPILLHDTRTYVAPTLRHNFGETPIIIEPLQVLDTGTLLEGVDGFIATAMHYDWSCSKEAQREEVYQAFAWLLREYNPKFFVIENATGMHHAKHSTQLEGLFNLLESCNYDVTMWFMNFRNYGLAQERGRTIIVGYHSSLDKCFMMPPPTYPEATLKDAIGDLPAPGTGLNAHNYHDTDLNPTGLRQKVRGWDEPSFTIGDCVSKIPFHPTAPPMIRLERDKYIMVPGHESEYHRLTVRECARIQGFPDSYHLVYYNGNDGYKLVGNSFPPMIAKIIGEKIRKDIEAP